MSAGRDALRSGDLRPLLLGLGWFPDQLGGLNRYYRWLFEAIRRQGVRSSGVVVGPGGDAPPEVTIVARHRDPLLRRLAGIARSAGAHAEGIDVVDAHFALYALWPVVFGRLRRLPLVVHFQGPWADEGVLVGDSWAVTWAKRFVERRVYARAAELITLSHAFKRVLSERYGIVPWKVTVLPPAVDLEAFRPGDGADARRALGLPADAWVVGICRRLVPRVGTALAVEAVALLEAGRAEEACETHLWIAGDGPERAALESQVARLDIASRVHFLGAISDEELRRAYHAADVAVVPSLALEGYGLVVLEALACGTPVISSETGALPEVVSPLDPSLVVATGDPQALARRLVAARDGSQPLPTRERSREFAERFSWSAVAQANLRIYERAVVPAAPSRPRIVFVDHVARLSGAELSLAQLLPLLEDVEVHVILGEDGPLVGRLLRTGVSVEVLPMAERARELPREQVGLTVSTLGTMAGTASYVLRLARRLRQLRPNLMQSNSLKAHLYGAVAARLAGVPSVLYLRDRIADDYLGGTGRFLVQQIARRLPRAIVANSAATLQSLPESLAESVVIPPAVDMPTTSPARKGSAPLRVGIVGRLSPTKGQDVFLRAFAQAFPSGDVVAVVVGSAMFGEDEFAGSLERLATELGIHERTEFRGFRSDVYGELADLDVLVHASPIPEPFGRVIVEGMAAGLPVIASAAGGPLEIVRDGVDGILSPIGDVPALADRLRRLAEDAPLRLRLGAAAADSARRFAPGVIAARWSTLYRSIVGGWARA